MSHDLYFILFYLIFFTFFLGGDALLVLLGPRTVIVDSPTMGKWLFRCYTASSRSMEQIPSSVRKKKKKKARTVPPRRLTCPTCSLPSTPHLRSLPRVSQSPSPELSRQRKQNQGKSHNDAKPIHRVTPRIETTKTTSD
ncbi:hypothetical protein L209DRAFT_126128 [Thermothelomyces heterothallicus CBS 203.75]